MTQVFKVFLASSLIAAATGISAETADPMADVCDSRARAESGYRAPLALSTKDGRGQVRLSGSVVLGGSSSQGPDAPGTETPAFAGAEASERREEERLQKSAEQYQRIYDDCMNAR